MTFDQLEPVLRWINSGEAPLLMGLFAALIIGGLVLSYVRTRQS